MDKNQQQTKFKVDELQKFYIEFNNSKNEILNKLKSSQDSLPTGIDNDILELKKKFNDNSMFLVAYDKDSYIKSLDDIDKEIINVKERLNPKRKFKFSSKQQKNEEKEEKLEKEKEKKEINLFSNEDYYISNIENQTIVLSEDILKNKKNLIIEKIFSSILIFQSGFKSVFVKNINNSTIFIPGISGGSHFTSIINSKIYLSTHQLRIHQSENTIFSVIVNSNPIIEHCHQVSFSNLKKDISFSSKEDEVLFENILKESNLYDIDNRFYNIHDFQWLKNEKSPNYIVDYEENNEKLLVKLTN